MAFGTLKADTLTHSTAGSLATNFVVDGVAKSHVVHDASGTVKKSLNISSVTDSGTGDFRPVFTTVMSDTNYNMLNQEEITISTAAVIAAYDLSLKTASTVRIYTFRADNGSNVDIAELSSGVWGDLA